MVNELLAECRIKHAPLKRFFDICFSTAALLCALPIFVVVSTIIFAASPGPVFYSHTRIGRGGKPFRCYKFRSMYTDADSRLKDILANNPEMHREWLATRKLKQDPRILPIGHFLRKSSLDELPQFWNVLKGDLSVVGPRPLVSCEIQQHLGKKAAKILSVRPGLTCIWQVSGRNDISYSKRIQLDEEYIDRQSFLLDLKLIAKTIPSMLFAKGAY